MRADRKPTVAIETFGSIRIIAPSGAMSREPRHLASNRRRSSERQYIAIAARRASSLFHSVICRTRSFVKYFMLCGWPLI